MSDKFHTSRPGKVETELASIRDLSDFCIRWPDLRQWVSDDALHGVSGPEDTLRTIRWLVLLADRVCYDFES